MRPEESVAAWGFRFLQGLPNVKMILSGMSNEQQLVDNIATFEDDRPLSQTETELILEVAEELKGSVPCTACRYCCDGCPMGLDIPFLLSVYNDLCYAPVLNTTLRIEALPESKKPDVCIGCGKCTQICPQKIDIPGALADFSDRLDKMPKWVDVCRERAAIQID
jgi:predicted aldo/keto reductase-like oxidoreductase